jgi:photosystem II stability/assembly factor-like uncharacterized protein
MIRRTGMRNCGSSSPLLLSIPVPGSGADASGLPAFQPTGCRRAATERRFSKEIVMRHVVVRTFVLAVVLGGCATQSGEAPEPSFVLEPQLAPQTSGTDVLLISVSVVNRDTVWVSGAGGTFARTTDGGVTWTAAVVPGADSLQFRDVHALDGSTASLLSIGEGGLSRIYSTIDAGLTWSLQFTNEEPSGFFDCLDFWDAAHGIAFSDSFEGRLHMIETADGGTTWTRIPLDRLPPANEGEGAFASSGTCLVALPGGVALVGTGASPAGPRILRTTDRGATWSAIETPIVAGSSAGITSLAFHDASLGSAVGGDIAAPDTFTDNVAITADGGATWALAARTPFPGAAYGTSWVPGAPDPTLVAVGPGGIAFTTDRAATWTALDSLTHWGVAFAAPDAGWAVGPGGRITRVRIFLEEMGS